MASILIRNVPDDMLARFNKHAASKHLSQQKYMLAGLHKLDQIANRPKSTITMGFGARTIPEDLAIEITQIANAENMDFDSAHRLMIEASINNYKKGKCEAVEEPVDPDIAKISHKYGITPEQLLSWAKYNDIKPSDLFNMWMRQELRREDIVEWVNNAP